MFSLTCAAGLHFTYPADRMAALKESTKFGNTPRAFLQAGERTRLSGVDGLGPDSIDSTEAY